MKTQENNVATKTILFSKKLLKDGILMAKQEQLDALEEKNKSRYMFFAGYESALKNIMLFKEEQC